jgi:hypothetical protein
LYAAFDAVRGAKASERGSFSRKKTPLKYSLRARLGMSFFERISASFDFPFGGFLIADFHFRAISLDKISPFL